MQCFAEASVYFGVIIHSLPKYRDQVYNIEGIEAVSGSGCQYGIFMYVQRNTFGVLSVGQTTVF